MKVYFMLGLTGFVLGYFLRIVTAVLKIIPAPAPVVPSAIGGTGAARDGPVTVFVKSHYHLVDFLVSLVLAFTVLLYLMKEGHPPDSAALLKSLMVYTGKYTIDGDKLTTDVDLSWNEILTGTSQVRFFKLEGDKLSIRTAEQASAVYPGKKVVGTLTWERER